MKKCVEFTLGGGSGAGCHGAVGDNGTDCGGTKSVVNVGHERDMFTFIPRLLLQWPVRACAFVAQHRQVHTVVVP